MSGPYCETCYHFSKNAIVIERGVCTDPTKIVYIADYPVNDFPNVRSTSHCMNYESREKL